MNKFDFQPVPFLTCKREKRYSVCEVKQIFTDSVADFSQFVPTSQLVQALKGSKDLGTASQIFYDYQDGQKFDGDFSVPVNRLKGLDRAEISQYIQKLETEGVPLPSPDSSSLDSKDNANISDSNGSDSAG